MRLPKYKFYTGKSVKFAKFTEGDFIVPETGEMVSGYSNSILSERKAIDSSTIFVNYDVSKDIFDDINNVNVEYMNVYSYDASLRYLGMITIPKSGIYELDKKAKYAVICFLNYPREKRQAHKSFIKNGFTELYAVHTVNPHYKTLTKKYTKENNQKFFREGLDGKINLFGFDYDYIKNSSPEDTLAFVISKLSTIDNTFNVYYKSVFNKTDCKLDYDKCSCELKLTALDAYTHIIDKYEDTYDLIKLAPALSKIDIYKRSIIQIYVKGFNTISGFYGGTYWEDDVNTVIDSHDDLINKYHFAYKLIATELYVHNNSGTPTAELNCEFAGTGGIFSSNKGYIVKLTAYTNNAGLKCGKIDVLRNSDNKIVYSSYTGSSASEIVSDSIYNAFSEGYLPDDRTFLLYNPDNTIEQCTISRQNTFNYRIYQRLLCDVDTIKIGTTETSTYSLPQDDFVTDNRNYKRCIGYTSGNIFCTAVTSTEPTRFGVNDYNEYFTNDFIPGTYGVDRVLPICRNSWVNTSLWFTYTPFNQYDLIEKALRKKYTIKHCFNIADVISTLLKQIDPVITHEPTEEYSQFLYGSKSPLPELTKFYVHITPKSNILKGNYDQPAQKAEITLKAIMDMLRNCFRCYWYIEDNKLKIEHIKFFMNGGKYSGSSNIQFDFTRLKDQFNKKLTGYFQSNLEFDKSELSSRYEFTWMDDATEPFNGPDVNVVSNYVQKDKKEDISVGQFSSDADYMLFDPNNFSSDGFALLCAVKNGNELEIPIVETAMYDEDNSEYTATIQNFYASWKYLLKLYMYDMPATNIKVNEGIVDAYEVKGIKKCAKQTMTFPAAEDPDTISLMKTKFGNGEVDEIKVNLDTRTASVDLLYAPF